MGFVAGLAMVMAMAPGFSGDNTIKVRADAWPPFNDAPASDHPGYVVEMLKAIFEPQGYKIDYQTMPWTRALVEVEAGRVDAVIGASPEEAPTCVYPKEEMGLMKVGFYTLKSNPWGYGGLDSLKKVKLAAVEGYSYSATEGALSKYLSETKPPAVQLMTGDDALLRNIRKLFAKHVDTVIESDVVFMWTVRNAKDKNLGIDPDGIKCAGYYEDISKLFVAFTPKRGDAKKLAEMFDAGIMELRKSGKAKEILGHYEISDWKK